MNEFIFANVIFFLKNMQNSGNLKYIPNFVTFYLAYMNIFTNKSTEYFPLNTGVFRICLAVAFFVCCFAGEVQADGKKFLKSIENYLDSSVVKGVDPNYVALPKKPWAVVLKSDIEQLDLRMDATDYDEEMAFTHTVRVKPPVNASVGLWAGYRGSGFGYSLSLSDNGGFNFGISMVAPSYALNLRISRFSFRRPESYFTYTMESNHKTKVIDLDNEFMDMFLSSPMKIGTVMADGYWVFNKKRFSLLAAYDQSTIQLRSAGSLIAGLMYYYQKYDYDSPKNFLFISSADKVGRMKIHQGSIGFGYTYNWVPARGLVVNAIVMPVLTLLNTIKASRYETIFPDDDIADVDEYLSAIQLNHVGDDRHYGGARLDINLKMAVSYNVKDWYFCVTGQRRHFRSDFDDITLKLTNWSVGASVGRRF